MNLKLITDYYDGDCKCAHLFLQVVFFRGVSSNVRKEVWPFLLGIFSWKSTTQERHQIMEGLVKDYKVLLAKKCSIIIMLLNLVLNIHY